jgi:hypothetical protein
MSECEIKGWPSCQHCGGNASAIMGKTGYVHSCANGCYDIKEEEKEIIMETIKSKRVLLSRIKSLLERTGDDLKGFPVSFSFSEGMGEPVFTFTVERSAEDHFIDEKGQKWVKA